MVDVRDATSGDIDAIAALHAAGWREGFAGIVPPELTPTPEHLARRMRERQGERLVAEVEGRLRGFCFFGPSRDAGAGPEVGEIYVLFVDPAAWRSGAGRALVRVALGRLAGFDEVTLWSAAENGRANAFYEALGFTVDGAEQLRPEFGNVREIRYRLGLRPRP
jgi:ribosomal protein S18 acetylase RimI-like enzyme